MRTTRVPLLALLCVVCGCTGFRPIVRGGDPRDVPPGTVPPEGTAPRYPGEERTSAGHPPRRLCRVQSPPTGYIATSYERASDCPPTADDDGYNAALVEHYADRRVGTTMSVCADQRIPYGWTRTNDEPSDRCPGARVGPGEPTSIIIRRQS